MSAECRADPFPGLVGIGDPGRPVQRPLADLAPDVRPGGGGDDAGHADLRAVLAAVAPAGGVGHLQQVADRVFHARARRGRAGHAHRDAAEGEDPGQLGKRRRVAVQPGRQRQQPLAVPPAEPGDGRVVGRVGADDAGQVPVRGGAEHRGQVADPGQVQLGRGAAQDRRIDQQRVRPAGWRGALDAMVQQHGERVRVAVDAGRGLHHDQRRARGRGELADVGDRPRPDGDHAAGPGDRLPGGRHGRPVGVYPAVRRPDGDPLDAEAAADHLGRLGPQVPPGHGHRRRGGQHDHAGAGPGELGDRAGQLVQRAVALDDPAQAKRSQPGGSRRGGQLGAQRVKVQRLSGSSGSR